MTTLLSSVLYKHRRKYASDTGARRVRENREWRAVTEQRVRSVSVSTRRSDCIVLV